MRTILMETEEMTTEEMINELKSSLEMLIWEQGISNFRITETFVNNLHISVEVEGLKIEIKDGVIIFSDIDENIFCDSLPVPAFVISSIKAVRLGDNDKNCVGDIELNDGVIRIDVL